MFTLKTLLNAFTESEKLKFEGVHYERETKVYSGDLWRLWPHPSGLESEKQNRLSALMDKRGMELRFFDEIITDDNGKVHELNPGYHGQIATYRILDGSVWSQDEAIDYAAAYVEALLEEEYNNRSDRWLTDEQLTGLGFIKFEYNAEGGFHPGQTDTPDSTAAMVEAAIPGATDFIFQITDVGQFDCAWVVWYRLEESE